jgi:nitrite reductase (NADH) large subunit
MGEPLVVIGNGMAAVRFVEELAKRALGRYAVAVIGDEPRLAYNRVLLSALLAQEVGFSEIELKPVRWWRDRGVTLRYGVRATAVDPVARNVTLSNGGKASLLQARLCDRLPADQAPHSRNGSAGCFHVPRHRRREHDR